MNQRTNVNNTFSEWHNILYGVPHGSIMGPLLFHIYLNDIFYFVNKSYIANYADDTTPYSVDTAMDSLLNSSETGSHTNIKWFRDNCIHAHKCTHMHTHAHMHACRNMHEHAYTGTHTHTCTIAHSRMHTCTHAQTCNTCTHVLTHAHVHIHPHMHTCTHMHTHAHKNTHN